MNLVQRGLRYAKQPSVKRRDRKDFDRFSAIHPPLASDIARVKAEHLTFLSAGALIGLAEVMLEIEEAGLNGEVIEAGAALGGSALILARSKSPARHMRLYDTFGLIPPPSDKDGADVHTRYEVIASGRSQGIGGGTYYGYHENLIDEVRDSFKSFDVPTAENNVELVQGLYEDTMVVDFPVALAHVDCDWYESVMTCLKRIDRHLVTGGRFVIDDYDSWSGARTAVDEFFANRPDYRMEKRTRLHIVKR